MGPVSWYRAMHAWFAAAAGFAVGLNAEKTFRGIKVIHNQSFHAACLYLLEKSSVSPRLANGLAIVATIGLVILFCWVTRCRYISLNDRTWPAESASLLVLLVLLSPVTWEQHLVLMIPTLYLITAEEVATAEIKGGVLVLLILFVLLSLVITRDLIGKVNYMILLEYHVQTLCMLIVFSIALLSHPTSIENGSSNYLDEPVLIHGN
jgi:hypothetical protein